MRVIKRNGDSVPMLFDKVTSRIAKLCTGLNVSPDKVAQKVFSSMTDGISTSMIDEISADVSINMLSEDPDYETLASRIIVSNMHKLRPKSFPGPKVFAVMIVPERDYDFTYFGIKTLLKMYLGPDETPQYMFMRVALGIHGPENPEAVQQTYELMSQKYFTHATPTLFNAGTARPQLSSCFLTGIKEDSVKGMYSTLSDCAQISKWSGGIGFHLHNVRANGSEIRGTKGISDGIIPMLRTFNSTARHINQGGGKRKGSFAAYLEPWHADIFQFLELRLNQGDEEARCRDLFTALWIPDLFMKRLEKGEPWSLFCPDKAPGLSDVWGQEFEDLYLRYESEGRANIKVPIEQLWSAILKSQIETGTPYMLYKDHCNAKSNQKHLGTIKSSNLCVAPESKVLTKNGYKMICTLMQESPVEIWNGDEWSAVNVQKTSAGSRLIRVNFSDGTFLECTEYHKFHIQFGYGTKSEIKEAKNLVPGDKLIKWTPPNVIEFGEDATYYDAYTHGFFCGDGTYQSTYKGEKIIPSVSLYGEKKELIDYLDVRSTSGDEDSQGRINILLQRDLPNKFEVPSNKSVKTRLEWFAGLCDADGNIQGCPGKPTQKSICVASIHLSFLRDIQLMLHTVGVSSVIGLLHEAGERELPDGKGDTKMFHTQTCWRLSVPALGVETLIQNGFKTHRLNLDDFTPVTKDVRQYVRVTSVEYNRRVDETYCFNEPKRHMGIFNGVIAGNCTEIVEYTDPDEIAVCNLASVCLPRFVDQDNQFDFVKLEEVVRVMTRNLDKIIDVNFYPVPEAEKSNKRHRPIALGVQGLADVYQMMNLEFGSGDLNKSIFETIYWAACSESVNLASEKGTYETFDGSPWSQGQFQFDLWGVTPSDRYPWDTIRGKPLRNSLLVGPMPTATTSQIMGNNECFEPYTSNMYLRRTLAGEFVVLNKHLVKRLKEIGMWNKSVKDHIIRNQGSIQGLSDVPDHDKAVFKTVWEISQKLIIDMAAERGPFVCQSQSMNLHVEDPTPSKLSSIHMYAWKKGLKTGMYYLRTRPKARAIQFTLEPQVCTRDCMTCSA